MLIHKNNLFDSLLLLLTIDHYGVIFWDGSSNANKACLKQEEGSRWLKYQEWDTIVVRTPVF